MKRTRENFGGGGSQRGVNFKFGMDSDDYLMLEVPESDFHEIGTLQTGISDRTQRVQIDTAIWNC